MADTGLGYDDPDDDPIFFFDCSCGYSLKSGSRGSRNFHGETHLLNHGPAFSGDYTFGVVVRDGRRIISDR